MERLPAAGMLDQRLARGEIDRDVVVRLVETLADFHARAERGSDVDACATPAALARLVLENLDQAAAACARLDRRVGAAAPSAPPRLLELLSGAFTRFVGERRDLFERRIAQGRICEGHGDLHAGNLCLLSHGPAAPVTVVAFDCIEFSRALRCVDVAADLAFLLMDLDRLGFAAFGAELARRYADRTHDSELGTLLPFYKAHLAAVRAKVAALRGAGSDERSVQRASRAEALRQFTLAARFALPPLLVATCGLPGSGKSTVARAVAPALHLLHLQADFERKLLCGIPPEAATPPERLAEVYSGETSARTYARLHELARASLARGRGVLLDATYARAADRAAAAALAREPSGPTHARVPFLLLHCRVDDVEARRRLAARAHGPGQFSDADVAVYEQARPRFEAPDEVAPEALLEVAAGDAPEETAAAIATRAAELLAAAGLLPATFRAE
jgi:aminoglycoside phosphotransferase family enzyme/predicted kinase